MFEADHFQLIRGRNLAADDWIVVPALGDSMGNVANGVPPAPTDAVGKSFLFPLSGWLEQRQALIALKQSTGSPLGVWLAPTDDPASLEHDLPWLDLIAVHFPKFVDGRGYSTATLLRQRFGYHGELRAFGDIGRDQLFYLVRVGFDSFLIPEGRDAAAAVESLADFPESYQTAVDQAIPLFRRRANHTSL
jgi:uncharacterized protein (DUF934 family)